MRGHCSKGKINWNEGEKPKTKENYKHVQGS